MLPSERGKFAWKGSALSGPHSVMNVIRLSVLVTNINSTFLDLPLVTVAHRRPNVEFRGVCLKLKSSKNKSLSNPTSRQSLPEKQFRKKLFCETILWDEGLIVGFITRGNLIKSHSISQNDFFFLSFFRTLVMAKIQRFHREAKGLIGGLTPQRILLNQSPFLRFDNDPDSTLPTLSFLRYDELVF